ncbi:MAG TPA: AMP-binding protein [Luteolibacter sp.]
MDPTRLTDPGFWTNPTPLTWGDTDFNLWCEDQDALRGHVLFQTSGSSGAPKWIALSKNALLLSAMAVNRHLKVEPEDVWGLTLPLRHVGGFGVAARAFEAACRLAVYPGKWNAKVFAEWAGSEGVTLTSMVPAQVYDLVTAELRCPSSLRAVVVGGGRLDEALGQQARELGWPVLASYGMTESGSQIATQSLEQLLLPYESFPLPVLPIWHVKADEEERLMISGPALFSGEVTGEAGVWNYEPREGEWHRSGDRGRVEEGGVTILGRADSLLKILGELVDPQQIERDLIDVGGSFPEGSFAVAAVPANRTGHVLVPVFSGTLDRGRVEAVVDAYNATAPGFRRLLPPMFVETLPRSELGKIRRGELAELALRGISGLSSPDGR